MKMRTFILALMVIFCLPAHAQSQARPRPKDVQLIENLATPPQVKDQKDKKDDKKDDKSAPDPDVTTRKAGGDTITEYRIKGKLYQQRIQPASGPAYFLIDEKGEGKFTRVDGPDVKYSVPMWVLLEW